MKHLRIVISALLCLFALLAAPAAKAAAAEPSYKEYSVYSWDGLAPEEYGDKVIVMFHGFLSAMPNGFYKKAYRSLKNDFTVIGYNYDYFNVERNIEEFDRFYHNHLKGKQLIFGGTSLGAFWAGYLGEKYKVDKIVLSNPLVKPREPLNGRLGKHFSERRKVHVTVDGHNFDTYGELALPPISASKRLVVLTGDDDLSNPAGSARFFHDDPNAMVVIFNRGGHSIRYKKNPVAWAVLEAFIRN